MEDMNTGKSNAKFALYSKFYISKALFSAILMASSEGAVIKASWLNESGYIFELKNLTDHFGISLPDFFQWEFKLNSVSLSYNTGKKTISFSVDIDSYGILKLEASKGSGVWSYSIIMEMKNSFFAFSSISLIDNFVSKSDGIDLDSFSFVLTPSKSIAVTLDIKLNLGGHNLDFPLKCVFDITPKPKQAYLQLETSDYDTQVNSDSVTDLTIMDENNNILTEKTKSQSVHWIEINKSFKFFRLDRLGFVLSGKKVTLYITAGFNISVLQIDIFGFYITIPLSHDDKVDFGISGLAITLDKPPITISGGLYIVPGEDIYNGELLIKLSKFCFTALGSYCKVNNKDSFFLYMMLLMSIGGPPCFYVTGLALGFGINRAVKLPDVKKITDFPLVAAAVGDTKKSKGLNSKSSPAAVLSVLSEWIYPSDGSNFFTAGVKFTSFGLLNCFALLTVEFGNKLRISLLGTASVSIPPAIQDPSISPIAYAQMNLKIVVDPDEGIVEVIAVLSDESYILCKSCKLTGGFALCTWTKGRYKGDFFVSLGGCHHPLFKNTHYPELDKVGIDWKITDNLRLTANGYFAVTPTCMMAGADINLTYAAGNLKAWVILSASFLIKWKPFFYDISVFVSLGVSYRLKIWFVDCTFKFELSAGIHIWGPEFSGEIKITLFIISFTISFGDAKYGAPELMWNEFYDSFLKKDDKTERKAASNSNAVPLNIIQIEDGIIKKNDTITYVTAERLKISSSFSMPASKISLLANDNTQKQIALYDKSLGVVPMKIKSYTSSALIKVMFNGKLVTEECFVYESENGQFPAALWSDHEPGINEEALISAFSGLSLVPKENKISEIIPPTGSYKMDDLLANEPIEKNFLYGNISLPYKKDYSGAAVYDKIRGSIKNNNMRSDILNKLSKDFSIYKQAVFMDIGSNPQNHFLAEPILSNTGSDI